jgi:SAM-dependent methyltransferase
VSEAPHLLAGDEELELLRARFDYELADGFATPSGSYYWFRKRRQILALIERHRARLGRTPVVTDLGCGTGADLMVLRRALGPGTYIGIEGDPSALRVCELRRAHHRAEDVSFVMRDLTGGVPLDDATVDLAYCSEVVEHLPDPDALLADVARIVKPGGHLLLTTPNQPNVFQRSFWSGRRRARQAARTAVEVRERREIADATGATPLYGHISVRPVKAWDATLERAGFTLLDSARGALTYGSRRAVDREPVLAGMFALQAALDLLPHALTRPLSDQLIGLYRRSPA